MSEEIAEEIVEILINDIKERKGIGDDWDEIDEEIQNDIREEWKDIILSVAN